MDWKNPEQEMPEDQTRVLCIVETEQGKLRIVIAEHVSPHTVKSCDFLTDECENEELEEYDENIDDYWVKENWFESNLCEDVNYVMYYKVLAWTKIEIPEYFKKEKP